MYIYCCVFRNKIFWVTSSKNRNNFRFTMEDCFAELTNDAKVLYALMLDRASISKVNGHTEEDGTIRLYFTVEQAQKKLHRSRQSMTQIFQQLEPSRLICRRKQGLGRPAMITLNYPSNAKLIQPKEDGELPVRIKVENRIIYAPQATQTLWGILFP